MFSVDKPKLQGPNVVDKINLDGQNKGGEKGDKKKRKRIGGERVDVSKAMQGGGQPQGGGQKEGKKKNKNQKTIHAPVVSEEDVARQVKETLARLTEGNKGVKKGAKYRKEKREANAQRLQNEQEMEQLESKILKLTEFVTANELAAMMNVAVTQIIQTCFNLGGLLLQLRLNIFIKQGILQFNQLGFCLSELCDQRLKGGIKIAADLFVCRKHGIVFGGIEAAVGGER